MKREAAILGGGCFWCLEAVFSDLDGVLNVRPGYSGGSVPNPTYKQVCSNETGHAEVVQIDYDAEVLSFVELLEVFFSIHDPTTLNRQGGDVGTQYRSVIFYQDTEQRAAAEQVKARMAEFWEDPIVTEIVEFDKFYPAEEYHHNYFRRNPNQGYCQLVIAPKVAKFRSRFADKLRTRS